MALKARHITELAFRVSLARFQAPGRSALSGQRFSAVGAV